jgi:hypothetical protein
MPPMAEFDLSNLPPDKQQAVQDLEDHLKASAELLQKLGWKKSDLLHAMKFDFWKNQE